MSEPNRKYRSKTQRNAEEFNFRLVERDLEILRWINALHYLSITQIKRLVFPENSSKQSTQRRMKYLFHHGFVKRVFPLVQFDKSAASSCAYCLDKKGAELLEANGIEPYSFVKSGEVKHMFLQHALELSEFMIILHLALKDNLILEVKRFVCDFEVKSRFDNDAGMARFKLWSEHRHTASKKSFIVYPDIMIILQGKGDFAGVERLFFVEIDRGTESLTSVIRDKVVGYHLYREQNVFKKFGKFKNFRVLIQTNSAKRMDNMRKALTNIEGSDLVWITQDSKITPETILTSTIWLDDQFEQRSILRSS